MSATLASQSGVYTSLAELVKLQYKAKGFSFLPKQPIHSMLAGRHASRLRGRGLNFEEIRRYLPGDDVRTIDWKVTARTRKPHTRVFTEERDRPTLIAIDQRLSMFFGSQVNMKSVTAAEAAALAVWRVFSGGDRVGAVVFNDTDIVEIRPHRSRQRVMRILQAIVEQNTALGTTSARREQPAMLNRMLERVLRLATHDHLVCLISDLAGADRETQSLMTSIAHHNDVLVAFVYDPLVERLPQLGSLVASDGDLQLEFDSSDRSLLSNSNCKSPSLATNDPNCGSRSSSGS